MLEGLLKAFYSCFRLLGALAAFGSPRPPGSCRTAMDCNGLHSFAYDIAWYWLILRDCLRVTKKGVSDIFRSWPLVVVVAIDMSTTVGQSVCCKKAKVPKRSVAQRKVDMILVYTWHDIPDKTLRNSTDYIWSIKLYKYIFRSIDIDDFRCIQLCVFMFPRSRVGDWRWLRHPFHSFA